MTRPAVAGGYRTAGTLDQLSQHHLGVADQIDRSGKNPTGIAGIDIHLDEALPRGSMNSGFSRRVLLGERWQPMTRITSASATASLAAF